MNLDFYFTVLAVLFICLMIFCGWLVNKLVNKLMSKDYHSYKVAESIGSEKPRKPTVWNDAPTEDFGSMSEYNV